MKLFVKFWMNIFSPKQTFISLVPMSLTKSPGNILDLELTNHDESLIGIENRMNASAFEFVIYGHE